VFGRDKPPYEEAQPVVSGIRALLESTRDIQQLEWVYDVDDAA
jgi:hypothetical protein